MQIDLVKYMMTLKTFKRELSNLLDTKIPEGYIAIDAKKHQTKDTKK
jgi:hypothetical protein